MSDLQEMLCNISGLFSDKEIIEVQLETKLKKQQKKIK